MVSAEETVKSFEGDRYEISGDVSFAFWGGRSLDTIITLDGKMTLPTRRQLELLDQLLNYPRNIRPEVEKELFDYYQEHIYLSVMESGVDDEELTPRLTNSEQLWEILGEPSVRIGFLEDDDPDNGIEFRLSYYGCPWDEEHGFGMQIQNWKIVDYGGEIC